jgi:hypothetical protein
VLGLNALRLHDVDPIAVPCTFTREQLEQVRATIPASYETYGPTNTAELRAHIARERAGVQV